VDPQGAGQISVLSNFYYLLAVMLFFALDAHTVLLSAMVQSCILVPPLQPAALDAGAWVIVTRFGDFFTLGLRIAAPVIIVLLLVNVAMGFVVKTVPQINILVVGFPITIAVGLGVLGLSLSFYGQIFQETLGVLTSRLESLLGALGT
jgi:flagellar biosynthetic protein FliR